MCLPVQLKLLLGGKASIGMGRLLGFLLPGAFPLPCEGGCRVPCTAEDVSFPVGDGQRVSFGLRRMGRQPLLPQQRSFLLESGALKGRRI